MINIISILNYIAFVISVGGFVYGAIRVLGRNAPIYFCICICAAGCYMLEEIASAIIAICNGGNYTSDLISLLGILGCFCFLYSAHLGGEDMASKPEMNIKSFRMNSIAFVLASVLALILIAMLVEFAFKIYEEISWMAFVTSIIAYIPVVPAVSLSLYDLIAPTTEFKKFKYTRLCNLFIIIFSVFNVIYLLIYTSPEHKFLGLFALLIAIADIGLVVSCVKGVQKWKK